MLNNLIKVTVFSVLLSGTVLAMLPKASAEEHVSGKNRRQQEELMRRDKHEMNELRDDKRQLGKNYGALMREDKSIRGEEDSMRRHNGGKLTTADEHKLQGDEDTLQRQIRQDGGR